MRIQIIDEHTHRIIGELMAPKDFFYGQAALDFKQRMGQEIIELAMSYAKDNPNRNWEFRIYISNE